MATHKEYIEGVLYRILDGNTTNDHLGILESVNENVLSIQDALHGLIMVLLEKDIITEEELISDITDSYLWDEEVNNDKEA